MIVIIEGLDGVGKTTIAKRFAEKYDFEYVKESYTDNCKEKEQRIVRMLDRLLKERDYIYDRTTLIDDFVYSFLNKQRSTLEEYFETIASILQKCKICHLQVQDENILKERLEKRGDQFVGIDDLKQIGFNYREFYCCAGLEVCNVHLTGDIEKDVERIKMLIK